MKYIWIVILIVGFILGWIYTIYDVRKTFKEYYFTKAFDYLNPFVYFWIFANIAVVFAISLYAYIRS